MTPTSQPIPLLKNHSTVVEMNLPNWKQLVATSVLVLILTLCLLLLALTAHVLGVPLPKFLEGRFGSAGPSETPIEQPDTLDMEPSTDPELLAEPDQVPAAAGVGSHLPQTHGAAAH